MRECFLVVGFPTIWVEFATIAPRPLEVDLLFPCLGLTAAAGTCFARYLNALFCCVLMGEIAEFISRLSGFAVTST